MCAIIDANVVHEVFGSNLPSAGERFFDWLERGNERLVVGGKLLEELEASSEGFRLWASEAAEAGKMRVLNKDEVDAKTREVENDGGYESNDPHVLALAQVSGARLLYSNDGDLQADFKNRQLIDNPPGKVYSTRENRDFRPAHRGLLADRNLCRPPN